MLNLTLSFSSIKQISFRSVVWLKKYFQWHLGRWSAGYLSLTIPERKLNLTYILRGLSFVWFHELYLRQTHYELQIWLKITCKTQKSKYRTNQHNRSRVDYNNVQQWQSNWNLEKIHSILNQPQELEFEQSTASYF